jgi:hypothetical protein
LVKRIVGGLIEKQKYFLQLNYIFKRGEMLFVLSSALIYAYQLYSPIEYKPIINVLMHLLFISIISFFDIKDAYLAQMKNKKRFLPLQCFFLLFYYYISHYTPTLVFSFKIIDIVHVLSNNFNIKKYNKYFGNYEIF